MSRWGWIVAVLLVAASPLRAADPFEVRSVKGQFADVKDNLTQAIEGRGLVISYTAQVAEMLDRTAADLGAARRIYGAGEVLEFCSAKLSRQMMEADARNLVFCPYTIAIYTVPDKPGEVFLARKTLPTGPAFEPIDALLKDIVAEAAR
jgi:uncharacterized protein (DUF302 family)